MNDHFAAFSFVDRILAVPAAAGARGSYAIPAGIGVFPPCLMAEAVGQLAAWVAMAHIGFRGRPVAALARETVFVRGARPGQTLDLVVEIERADDEAVAYRGTVSIDGEPALALNDALGPMLPVADFDDPSVLAERFALLCAEGAVPGRFRGVTLPRVMRDGGVPGVSATGSLAVPTAAPFFNDHFPRRPVFPATLLLEAKMAFAMALASEATHWPAGTSLSALRMSHVKIRAFTPPGQVLTIVAELKPPKEGVATCWLTASNEGKAVATARVDIGAAALSARVEDGP